MRTREGKRDGWNEEGETDRERERGGGALIYTAPKRMNTKLKCMTAITK